MKTLTKHGLAKMLAAEKRLLWMTQEAAVDVIETLLDLITLHFQNGGEKVALRGFGSFKLVRRKKSVTCDPRLAYGNLTIPATKSVGFKPSAAVKQRINL